MTIRLSLLAALLTISAACQHAPSEKGPTVSELKANPSSAAKSLVGLPLEKAKAMAAAAAIPHRVIKIDGQVQPATMDYRLDRLNFTVKKGVVTEVTKG